MWSLKPQNENTVQLSLQCATGTQGSLTGELERDSKHHHLLTSAA